MAVRKESGLVRVATSILATEWDAVCVLSARAGETPEEWLAHVIADSAAAGVERLPDRTTLPGFDQGGRHES